MNIACKFIFIFVLVIITFSKLAYGKSKFYDLSHDGRSIIYSIMLDLDEELAQNLVEPLIPTPPPDEEPKPEPSKKEKNESFFDGDDDFFADDNFFDDELSYDEAKQKIEKSYENTVKSWQKDYQKTIKGWEKDREKFLGNIEKHKSATIASDDLKASLGTKFQLSTQVNLSNKEKTQQHFASLEAGEFYIVENAFDIPVRDQKFRPTCAAFTGIRAIEIALSQKKQYLDLSEQYFYQISKPECAPCDKGGSHFYEGIVATKNGFPIIQEKYCPYNMFPVKGNDTQYPLADCNIKGLGVVVPESVDVNVKSPWGILTQLNQDRAVMIGIRLPPNFYTTNGFVTLAESTKTGNVDSHASGHAVLLSGYIRLPKSLHASEGRYCAITANSWGRGYGKFGYTCLTEKWIHKFSIGDHWQAVSNVTLTQL